MCSVGGLSRRLEVEQGRGFSRSAPTLQGYLSYIKSLPLNDMPEIFGLHDNANITCAQNETYTLLGTIVQLQPKSSSAGGQHREEVSGSRGKGPVVEQDQSPIHHHACSPVGRNSVHIEFFVPTDSGGCGPEHSAQGA